MNLPTIPDYFRNYVDPQTDLIATPHIPCPFHNEQHGKSFSYNIEKKIWRCFGECHCGGDVIDLHRLNKRFRTREEAKLSLYAMFGIKEEIVTNFEREPVKADENEVYRNRLYNRALQLAKTPDDWIELDYLLSQVPFAKEDLERFCRIRGFAIEPMP